MKFAAIIALSLVASFQAFAAGQSKDVVYQCASFIRTGHPGINYTLPYGEEFSSLLEAKRDALARCRESDKGRTWGGLCETACVQHD